MSDVGPSLLGAAANVQRHPARKAREPHRGRRRHLSFGGLLGAASLCSLSKPAPRGLQHNRIHSVPFGHTTVPNSRIEGGAGEVLWVLRSGGEHCPLSKREASTS